MSLILWQQSGENLLFLVICGISEYTWVKMVPNPFTTLDRHSMAVCFQEIIVEDDRPLDMIDFSMTMAHKCGVRSLATNICCKGLKGIRKLSVPEDMSFM